MTWLDVIDDDFPVCFFNISKLRGTGAHEASELTSMEWSGVDSEVEWSGVLDWVVPGRRRLPRHRPRVTRLLLVLQVRLLQLPEKPRRPRGDHLGAGAAAADGSRGRRLRPAAAGVRLPAGEDTS
jgi:hypothetical protein